MFPDDFLKNPYKHYRKNLYRLKKFPGKYKSTSFNKSIAPSNTNSSVETAILWHKRLAHASLAVIKHFLYVFKPTEKLIGISNIDFCDVCVWTKLTQKAHDKVRVTPTRPAEAIAADIIGPILPTTAHTGYKYILTMMDVYTKYGRIFLLRRKSETVRCIKVFFNMVRAQFPTPEQMKWLSTDNGTEFVNEAVKKLLREYGIEHRLSEPDQCSQMTFSKIHTNTVGKIRTDWKNPHFFFNMGIKLKDFVSTIEIRHTFLHLTISNYFINSNHIFKCNSIPYTHTVT